MAPVTRYGAFYFRSSRAWVGEFGAGHAARCGAHPSKPNISPSCWRLPVCAAHAIGFNRSAAASCFVRSCSRLLVGTRVCGWASWASGDVTRATPHCGGFGGVGTSFARACVLALHAGGRRGVVRTVFVVRRRVGSLLLSVVALFGAPAAVVGGGARVRALCLFRRCFPAVFPAAASSTPIVSLGGLACPAPAVACVFRRGAVGFGSRRAAGRVAACAVVMCISSYYFLTMQWSASQAQSLCACCILSGLAA